jgi:hypothetical protein
MKNPVYVVYDDDMNLKLIVSYKPEDTTNFFVTEKSTVREFYLGKNYPGHYIKCHGFNKFTIEEKNNSSETFVSSELVDISINNYKTDLTIFYNKDNWSFVLDSEIGKTVASNYYNNILEFYLVKNNQHNFLIRTFKITVNELINGPVNFLFENYYEKSINNLLIKSKKHFNTMGIHL